jgi:hypothetical protein
MEEFKLNSKEIEILKSFIGKEIKTILSKTSSYDFNEKQFELYESTLLKIDNNFIALKIEEEKGIGFEDDFIVSIKEQETPEPFEYEVTQYNSIQFNHPLSILSIWKNIQSICIISKSEEKLHNNLFSALIFNIGNDENICLTLTIPLKLQFKKETLENLLRNSKFHYLF